MVTRILLSTTVHWPSTARLASAFAAVGAQVDALYPAGHVNAKSRFVCGRYLYNPLLPLPSLALAIEDLRRILSFRATTARFGICCRSTAATPTAMSAA